MKFLFTFILFANVYQQIVADYVLNIRMEYFKNENADFLDKKLYFKYCLIENELSQRCDAQFETNILGENTITEEQFKLTTDSINFKILNEQLTNRDYLLNLSISTMSANDNLKKSVSFISNWNLFIDKSSTNLFKLNKWIKFNQINFDLKQQLTFNYKLKCSDNYQGSNCDIPICSSGCDLSKGGYCEKPNQCLCKQGWTGENCDKIQAKCDLECKNGGQCMIENDQQFCKCDTKFYKGDLCQIKVVHPCNSRCFNGGSCLADNKCLCAPGYIGDRCQTKTSTNQCGSFSCLNGGTCFIDNQNEYSCLCSSNFNGKNCQNEILLITKSSTKSQPTISSIDSTTTQNSISEKTTTSPIQEIISESKSLSSTEIVLILIAGIGIPFLAILVAIIFYRSVISNKNKNTIVQDFAKKEIQAEEIKPNKKENIYVSCATSANQAKKEINTISLSCEKNLNTSDESEIYSNCIYDEINEYDVNKKAKSIQAENKTNSKSSNIYSDDFVSYV